MELLDTSVLILARRRPSVLSWAQRTFVSDELAVCDVVALEYLRGARSAVDFAALDDALHAFPWLRTETRDWDRAIAVARAMSLVAGGYQRSVGIPDLLIAATAERHGVAIVHYDSDYDRIAAVTGQATRWIVPAGSVET